MIAGFRPQAGGVLPARVRLWRMRGGGGGRPGVAGSAWPGATSRCGGGCWGARPSPAVCRRRGRGAACPVEEWSPVRGLPPGARRPVRRRWRARLQELAASERRLGGVSAAAGVAACSSAGSLGCSYLGAGGGVGLPRCRRPIRPSLWQASRAYAAVRSKYGVNARSRFFGTWKALHKQKPEKMGCGGSGTVFHRGEKCLRVPWPAQRAWQPWLLLPWQGSGNWQGSARGGWSTPSRSAGERRSCRATELESSGSLGTDQVGFQSTREAWQRLPKAKDVIAKKMGVHWNHWLVVSISSDILVDFLVGSTCKTSHKAGPGFRVLLIDLVATMLQLQPYCLERVYACNIFGRS